MQNLPTMTAGQAREAIELRFALLASIDEADGETPEARLEVLADRGLELWLDRPGRPNSTWLRDNKHPLERLAEDLDWLTDALRSGSPARRQASAALCDECGAPPKARHSPHCAKFSGPSPGETVESGFDAQSVLDKLRETPSRARAA